MSIPTAADPRNLAWLRSQIIGADARFETPFGSRLMVYGDYTASGRCLVFIERYLLELQRIYANTHTEDDVSGRSMSRLLGRAEELIRQSVNAGPEGKLIAIGTGCTAAIDKLQQILGVAIAPATLGRVMRSMSPESRAALQESAPVVFLGPYEHHSNEITWRQGLARVVTIPLDSGGGIDRRALETALKDPRWKGRMRIGSFSAASNVTGMLTPVHELAELLHHHGALACFDYAACAPYVPIDMNPAGRPEARLDAVFISPHKFLGGPGSTGVLVFNQNLYDRSLAPTVAGGGTVDYVGPENHDFVCNIEEREKAGTPGVLQTLKAALAFELKEHIGTAAIEAREQQLLGRAFAAWQAEPAIEILGNPDPARRVAIVSFNLKDPWGSYLHPKLVTVLLNDLFGIQSRAGCSCAGPYGHHLLGIDNGTSERYRRWVQAGFFGIKPGWCRIGFHFAMDDAEADYIIECVRFVAREGWRFLHLYRFDLQRAIWSHAQESPTLDAFSLEAALSAPAVPQPPLDPELRRPLYDSYLRAAESLAATLADRGDPPRTSPPDPELASLMFFRM